RRPGGAEPPLWAGQSGGSLPLAERPDGGGGCKGRRVCPAGPPGGHGGAAPAGRGRRTRLSPGAELHLVGRRGGRPRGGAPGRAGLPASLKKGGAEEFPPPRRRLSINPPAKGFGGKDSVKGNRQGSLSRWIKQLFETFLKFQKVQQPVERAFSTG